MRLLIMLKGHCLINITDYYISFCHKQYILIIKSINIYLSITQSMHNKLLIDLRFLYNYYVFEASFLI